VPTHTQALPPLSEKDDKGNAALKKGQVDAAKDSFWKKFVCW
jgi:hypothetical protein